MVEASTAASAGLLHIMAPTFTPARSIGRRGPSRVPECPEPSAPLAGLHVETVAMHAVGASGEASSSTSLNTVTLTTLEAAVSSNAMSGPSSPPRCKQSCAPSGRTVPGGEVHLFPKAADHRSRRSLRNTNDGLLRPDRFALDGGRTLPRRGGGQQVPSRRGHSNAPAPIPADHHRTNDRGPSTR